MLGYPRHTFSGTGSQSEQRKCAHESKIAKPQHQPEACSGLCSPITHRPERRGDAVHLRRALLPKRVLADTRRVDGGFTCGRGPSAACMAEPRSHHHPLRSRHVGLSLVTFVPGPWGTGLVLLGSSGLASPGGSRLVVRVFKLPALRQKERGRRSCWQG